MTNPVVFVIHGMGVHNDGWHTEDFVEPLVQVVADNDYAEFKGAGKGVEDRLDIVPIRYDDVFQEALDAWDENAASLLAQATPGSREIVEKAVGWLGGISRTEDNFGWTHAADVLLWKVSPYFRNTIINHVAETIVVKLTGAIASAPGHNVVASVVSHSLGTSVIHDALVAIMRGEWTGPNANGFAPQRFHFDSLHTIANVSRLLQFDSHPAYTSGIQPGGLGATDSYCLDFYNYHNAWDPFTLPKPFEPDWDVRRFHDKPSSHLHDSNPHSIAHYLRHPRVHVPLLRALCSDYMIVSPAEEARALDNFSNLPPQLEDEARQQIETWTREAADNLGGSADLVDLVKAIALYFQSR